MCSDTAWRELIGKAITTDASDLHLTVGQKPHMRCLGILTPMDKHPVTAAVMKEICSAILNDGQQEKLEREREIDLSWTFAERRFRVHAYYQQGWLALAFRLLPERIPSLVELMMPKAWQKMKDINQGLILVTGRTGSGKSTTLAAFIEELNHEKPYHIVTLEDPIEYVFRSDKCFISQREYGNDFYSFANALRGSLREMPDLILVGEIRDYDTLATALAAASAGMLVLGTLHSTSAAEAVLRMEGMCPLEEQSNLRSLLAEVLQGIFAQQLVPAVDGSRTVVTEVLLANPAVRSLIRQGKYNQLVSVMLSQQTAGMQTLATAAQKLWQAGQIDRAVYDKLCSQQGGLYDVSL